MALEPKWSDLFENRDEVCTRDELKEATNVEQFQEIVEQRIRDYLLHAHNEGASTSGKAIFGTPFVRFWSQRRHSTDEQLPMAEKGFSCTSLVMHAWRYAGIDIKKEVSSAGIFLTDFEQSAFFEQKPVGMRAEIEGISSIQDVEAMIKGGRVNKGKQEADDTDSDSSED